MLDHYRTSLPEADRSLREAVLARFVAEGFPGKTLEDWHYTDFTTLADTPFVAGTAVPLPHYPFDAAQPLPFTAVSPGDFATGFALENLNAALASQGVSKRWQGQGAVPLLITHADPGAEQMAHWRHQLSMAPRASATLIVWDAPGAGASSSLLTAVLRLSLEEGSRLTVLRVQQAPATATRALHIAASLAANAKLELYTLDLSEAKSRFELLVDLAGAGAQVEVVGLTAVKGKAHADTHVQITHSASHCTSRMNLRLLAAEKAKAIFNGKVLVQPGAIKTDSETHCHSLLLSATAEIDAKPELEINADDVKCSHGATFGQLDEEAAFYLRSRGIAEADARKLLTQAFSESVLERIPHAGLRAHAEAQVQALLAEAQS